MGIYDNLPEIVGNNYFSSVIAISASILVAVAILSILNKYIRRKTKNNQETSKRLMRIEVPLILIIISIIVEIVLDKLIISAQPIDVDVTRIIHTLLIVVITYAMMVISSVVLEAWTTGLGRKRSDSVHEEVLPIVKSFTNIMLGLIALFIVLSVWGVAVGTLLASVGVIGIVLGFAFKDTLTNIFGGLELIMDDNFRKGDLVELQDGEMGYVMEISLRSTKIRNFDLEEVVIPNGLIANMKIKNYAQPTGSIRIKIHCGTAYGTNPDKVEKLALEEVRKRDDVLDYPKPWIVTEKMADYSLEYLLSVYIKDYHDMYRIKSEITKQIYNALQKNKITIPFPTRTIYIEKKRR